MEQWQRRFIKNLFHYSRGRMSIESAFLAKHPHVPRHLYKFRNFSPNHLDALQKGVLWMSSPDKFNDPFDTTVFFDPDRFLVEDMSREEFIAEVKAIQDAAAKGTPFQPRPLVRPIQAKFWREKIYAEFLASNTTGNRDKLIEFGEHIIREQGRQMRRNMSEQFRNGFSVLSLAGNPTAILMWSHYSDSHRGFCIEYDFGSLPPDDLRRRLCFPVLYRGKRTDATRYMAKRDPAHEFNNLFGQYLCLLKERDWSYEQEWRIVDAMGAAYANKQIGMPMPSAIILGSRVKPDDEKWMREFCAKNGIRLKRAVEVDGQIELQIQDA
jgi:hypothetical protein